MCPSAYAWCPVGGRVQQRPGNPPAGILSGVGVGVVSGSCWGLGGRSHVLRVLSSPPGFKRPPVGFIHHAQDTAEGQLELSPADLTVVDGKVLVFLDEKTFLISQLLLVVVELMIYNLI